MPHTKYIFSSQAIFGFSMLLVFVKSSWVHLVWVSSSSRSLSARCRQSLSLRLRLCSSLSPLFHWIVCCQDLSSPEVDGEDEISSCPSRKERNICSSVVGAGGPITASGRLCVSLTSFCSSFSTSGTSGFGAGCSAVAITHLSKSSNWFCPDLCPMTTVTFVASLSTTFSTYKFDEDIISLIDSLALLLRTACLGKCEQIDHS